MAASRLDACARMISERLRRGALVVVLSGAGVSAESGLPTYRGAGGLWSRPEFQELAALQALLRSPARVWQLLQALRELLAEARPNPAHFALAELQEILWPDAEVVIVTQNVDGLHQMAGSRQVVELHGNAHRFSCMVCGRRHPAPPLGLTELPPRCACGGIIRPDVVFFDESLPPSVWQEALALAERAAVFVVVGTSLEVEPAASLPFVALERGALVVEVNLEPSVLSQSANVFLRGFASHVLPALAQRLREVLRRPAKKVPIT
jgi:NAD-dependent deacetylase